MIIRFLLVIFVPISHFLFIDAAWAEKELDVTYCIDPNWMPYEAIRNGKHIGISADYLQLIHEITQINFTLYPTENWQETLAAVESGRCTMTTMINKTPTRSHFFSFSHPYIEAPNVMVSFENFPLIKGYEGVGNRKVGVVRGYRHAEYLASYYPQVMTEYVDTETEGLRKLASGDIDIMVGSLLSVYAAVDQKSLNDLHIVGLAEPFDVLTFGVNKQNKTLIPILNDAIERIPEIRKVQIYKRWNNAVVAKKQYHYWMIFAVVFAAAMVIALITWRRRVTRSFQRQIKQKNQEIETLQSVLLEKNRTLEFLSAHDSVTGLYNRNYLMHKAEEEISRFQRFYSTASLIIIEVDENRWGQKPDKEQQGKCYRLLAKACLATVREVDIAARWSTERFAILCPQTEIDAALSLAERLLDTVKNAEEPCLTVSVGVAQLKPGQSFTHWNDEATRALTIAKRNVGNNVQVAD